MLDTQHAGGAHQLSLFESEASVPPVLLTEPVAEQSQEDQTLDLTTYSRDNLKHQGPHDQARRSWLSQWAEQRGHTAFWFMMYHKYDGYTKHGIQAGGWTGFLERAVQYDIYCCFVAAFTPDVPLEHYLEDAAKRGEIKLDAMALVWRPANKS